MDYGLKPGMTYTSTVTVVKENTAAAFGSGDILVFSTPNMIGLMENAALNAVDPSLPEGYNTVGTHLDVRHLAATPIGMQAKATATLVEVSGKKLVFRVEAFDDKDKIGEGTHERYIVNTEKFMKAIDAKR